MKEQKVEYKILLTVETTMRGKDLIKAIKEKLMFTEGLEVKRTQWVGSRFLDEP